MTALTKVSLMHEIFSFCSAPLRETNISHLRELLCNLLVNSPVLHDTVKLASYLFFAPNANKGLCDFIAPANHCLQVNKSCANGLLACDRMLQPTYYQAKPVFTR